MKCFYIITVFLCIELTLCKSVTRSLNPDLVSPRNISIITKDPPQIEVKWQKVESPDPKNPIDGYKVTIWESKIIKKTVYKDIDGEVKPVEEEVEEDFDNKSIAPDDAVEYIVSADQNSVTHKNIKIDVYYNIRVVALTKTEEGPFFNTLGVKLG